jgi:beta-lactamase superfamily II metal-dependent hydrolase
VACDVGQGDGLVLATSPGHAVLVDAGPDPALIDGCLRRLGVQALDSVVLTHFHADHVDGLPGALAGRSVREILATPVHEPDFQWREVQRWAAGRGIPVRAVSAGDRLYWPGITADVWWPARRIAAGSVPNNASVVLAVRAGPLRALLLGDVEAQAEQAMKNIALLLEEAGGALEHVVKVTVYLIDPRYREPVYRGMGRWLKGVYPVSTGIVVSALARPEWLVEIDATAVISEPEETGR